MRKSDLPFGSEFSPDQIDLVYLLELANANQGNRREFEDFVRVKYFESHKTSDRNKRKLANNTKISMTAYGIIDRNVNLTRLGMALHRTRHKEKCLYDVFAKHILLNLYGVVLVQCIRDMHIACEKVTLIKMREWLMERGVCFPRGGKHPSIMRLWLEKSGVFSSGWNINELRLRDIIGASVDEIEELAILTREQRAYIKTIVNVNEERSYNSNDLERLASATYGVKFDEKNLPKQVLYPLQKQGYITLKRGTKRSGRGAKPFIVHPTEKLKSDIIAPLIAQMEKLTHVDIRPLLRQSIREILAKMRSKNKYIAGLALEALAFKLMRLIDLEYVATRLKGSSTGGAEVDLVFDSSRLVFSRWQIQCKNTRSVGLDSVAKEVGLTHFLKSNVIVIVSTGKIGKDARRYSNKIMADSNISIVMMDADDVNDIVSNPVAIIDILKREAKHAMMLKKIEI